MSNYGVNQITSLEGLTAIQLRPAMYIGTTGQDGINQILYEVWDNSLDEYVAGYGNQINITIDKDNYITIEDFGRGIPVGDHPEWKNEDGTPMNTLTGVLTKLHAGGKFNRDGSSGYFNGSTGTYGIGSKATNALSDDFIVNVKRDNKIYQQTFSKGKPTSDVKVIGTTKETGTTIKFHPDKDIFKETIIPNDKKLQSRLHEITALNANLKIHYINEIAKVDKVFHYPNGINDYIKNELLLNKKTLFENPLYYKGEYKEDNETMTAEICFIYQDNIEDNQIIKTFANNITTREHGTHLNGFKESFRDNINNYGIKQKLINSPLEIKYLLDNICLIISVHLKECELEGQTKNKLGNIIAKDGMISIVNDFFKSLTKEQKEIINTIITRANAVREAEEAARKARINSRKANKITKIALPGKLADCSSNKGYSEIFFCLKGDTKVKLLNGTDVPIQDLVGKEDIWCYSCNKQMQMIPAKINKAFKTREVTQMIKLTFDDNSVIECTPEHRFLDRDTLQWVQAKDLTLNQSLGSMKFQIPKYDPHPMVWIPIQNRPFTKGHWEFIHLRVAECLNLKQYNGKRFNDIHHKDFNMHNNDPSNLISLTKKDHLAIHNQHNYALGIMEYSKKHFTPESLKRMQEGYKNISVDSAKQRTEKIKQAWKDGKFANATWKNYNTRTRFKNGVDSTQVAKICKFVKYLLDNQIEITQENYDNNRSGSTASYNTALNKYFTSKEEMIENAKNYNLKVINIEYINYENPIPVYCMEVENDFHSFVLSNGVITHNCEGMSAAGCFTGDTILRFTDGQAKTFKQLYDWYKEKKRKKYIFSYNIETNVIEQQLITDCFITKQVNQLCYLTLNTNEVIKCTIDHKFLLQDNTYKQAKDLTTNDQLKQLINIQDNIRRKVIKNEIVTLDEFIDVYDITVPPNNNFVLNNVFVHNSAKSARDSSFQAIMPLRGKILNTEKVDFDKAMTSDTAKTFIASIGTGIGKHFDINKCRYDKIIMMCFTGDTKVKLFNGLSLTFEELAEMERQNPLNVYYVYSINEHNQIVMGEAINPRITNYTNKILYVHLSNGQTIKCTDNHLFMLDDMTYKSAITLEPNDKLRTIDNCYITSINTVIYDRPIPVYDITVKEYHNFALDCGVFVHNCDADVDGLHISNLILTLIYNYMRPLLSEGYVYNTMPPLYKVIEKKKMFYLQNDEELKRYRKTHKDFVLQRFKGLGEMDFTELWETTMNPETRTLKRITIEDAEKMIQAFDICMGKDVEARRLFIEENAYKANLVE